MHGCHPRLLHGGEVHVWHVGLDRSALQLGELNAILRPDERVRASRFRHAGDRDRFIAARGLLRRILGDYLAIDPAQLAFVREASGKPALEAGPEGPALRFNVSHSHDRALFAVALHAELGIDIERVRMDIEYEALARRFFSGPEVAGLVALPVAQRLRGFYACWTRKEAYLKARGEGLLGPLDQFSVSVTPDEPVSLLHDERDPAGAARWSIHGLDVGPDYAAALAVAGGMRVREMRMEPAWPEIPLSRR
jgi:4'-phosphopantetheinyl transferase